MFETVIGKRHTAHHEQRGNANYSVTLSREIPARHFSAQGEVFTIGGNVVATTTKGPRSHKKTKKTEEVGRSEIHAFPSDPLRGSLPIATEKATRPGVFFVDLFRNLQSPEKNHRRRVNLIHFTGNPPNRDAKFDSPPS